MQAIYKLRSVIELSRNKIDTILLSKTKFQTLVMKPNVVKVPVIVALTSYPGRIDKVQKTRKTH